MPFSLAKSSAVLPWHQGLVRPRGGSHPYDPYSTHRHEAKGEGRTSSTAHTKEASRLHSSRGLQDWSPVPKSPARLRCKPCHSQTVTLMVWSAPRRLFDFGSNPSDDEHGNPAVASGGDSRESVRQRLEGPLGRACRPHPWTHPHRPPTPRGRFRSCFGG